MLVLLSSSFITHSNVIKGAGAAASEGVRVRERERERGAENKGTHNTDNFNHVHQLSFIAWV
jgi:hypothetical protein